MPTTDTPQRGYSATKDELLTRLRRIEGQVRGIQRMVEDDRYCIDVLTQIGAIQAAIDKVALGLLDDHARHCVLGAGDGEQSPIRPPALERKEKVPVDIRHVADDVSD